MSISGCLGLGVGKESTQKWTGGIFWGNLNALKFEVVMILQLYILVLGCTSNVCVCVCVCVLDNVNTLVLG